MPNSILGTGATIGSKSHRSCPPRVQSLVRKLIKQVIKQSVMRAELEDVPGGMETLSKRCPPGLRPRRVQESWTKWRSGNQAKQESVPGSRKGPNAGLEVRKPGLAADSGLLWLDHGVWGRKDVGERDRQGPD